MKQHYLTPSLEVYSLQMEGCVASSIDEMTIDKFGEEEEI